MTDEASTRARGVVTPEAVRLDFSTAAVGTRALAKILDVMIQSIMLGIVVFALMLAAFPGAGFQAEPWLAISLVLLASFLILFGYPVLFETIWRGKTPGKAALGLRVVTREGAPIQFRHAAIRAALGLVEFQVTAGAAAVVSSLLSQQHQRLGDHVAGTIVLRERESRTPTSPARFTVPQGGRSYAETLDPAVLNPQEYQAVRTFLLRAGSLPTDARAGLAQQIAHPLALRLGHRPPANVTPEQFLLCLAARYQQRTVWSTQAAGPSDSAPGRDFGGQSVPPPPA